MNKVLNEDFTYIKNSEELEFEKFKNSSIFITGATGLIGSLLVKFFLYLNDEYNYNVHIYALIRNKKKAQKIFGANNRKKFHYVISDLSSKNSLEVKEKIDYIVHAAAITNSKYLISNPVNAIKVSVNGTEKVLDLAIEKRVQSVVYISSMEVYGQPSVKEKVTESDLGNIDLTKARSCYPEGKRMCECICEAYASQFDLNVKIARLAQTFGAGVLPEDKRVFAQFTKSIMNGQNIILHTQGTSEGNYVYTADAIKAILLLLLNGKKGEPYNVVNEHSHTTIMNMAKMVVNKFGNKDQKVIVEIPNKDLGYAPEVHMTLSGEKLRALKWDPKFNLIDSYKRLIEYNKLEREKYEHTN